MILPNINFNTPNPHIKFKETNMKVPVELTPWPEDQAERAGVNSFGIGGANAHVILDSARFGITPTSDEIALGEAGADACSFESRPTLMILSAASSDSLQRGIAEHQKYVTEKKSLIRDVSYTLCCRRDHLQYRAFCVTTGDALQFSSPVKCNGLHKVTMIFTGQGAVWAGMGKELLARFPTFNDDIESLDSVLAGLPEHAAAWNIKEELLKPDSASRLAEAQYAQPVTTAIQIALVNLLESWAVSPSAVIGHSSGEIAAAYAAKAIMAKEAMIIAYYRGRVASSMINCGAMAAVGLSQDEVAPFLEEGVAVACENSPNSVTLSGDMHVLERVCRNIKDGIAGTFVRLLGVGVAYHSRKYSLTQIGIPYLLANEFRSNA
jgi:acyl transferase domain-containing protein